MNVIRSCLPDIAIIRIGYDNVVSLEELSCGKGQNSLDEYG